MILETTNPKFAQRAQFTGTRIHYSGRVPEVCEGLGVGESSRSMSKGEAQPVFRDRRPSEAPIHEPEPELRTVPLGSSMWLADENSEAPLWLVLDRVTGVTFARVRGSLPWVIKQIKLVAHQLGGAESDLYYRRAT